MPIVKQPTNMTNDTQIVKQHQRTACCCCCVVVVFVSAFNEMSMATTSEDELARAQGPENWRSTPGRPGGARKMPNPTSPPNPAESPLSLCTLEDPRTLAMN